jgi:hypothetical protein
MRRLSFGTEQVDKDRFDILYSGLCMSPRGVQRTELVTFNSLLTKLEDVAKRIENPPPLSPVHFELGDKGGVALLEEPEFALLNAFHDQVKWTSIATRKAAEAYKWLSEIAEEKLELAK